MSSPIDLSVRTAGLNFPNPFVLGSGPPTRTGEMIERAFDAGWGGAITKTLAADGTRWDDVRPRMARFGAPNKVLALSNVELCSMRSLEKWARDIERIKRNWPDRPLIASLLHTYGNSASEDEWTLVARWAEASGADALELNFGCSHGMADHGAGASIGRNPSRIEEVTSRVKQAVRIPVIVKLPAAPASMGFLSRAAQAAGADAITAINSVPSLVGVDLDKLAPMPSVEGNSAFAGLSGIAVKPVGLRCVAEIRQAVDLPILGVGGISRWSDAAEFLLVGANLVQVCTAVMLDGFKIIRPLLMGLERYMAEKGFASVAQMSGRVVPQLQPLSTLTFGQRVVVAVNEETCIRCGKCEVACRDAAYQAFDWKKGELPVLHEQHCDGCSLCIHVCPVSDCITTTFSDLPYVERYG